MTSVLFDTHCHLDLLLEHQSINKILKDCDEAGVNKIIVLGLAPSQWPTIAQLCENHERLFFAVGLHPWWIEKTSLDAPLDELMQPCIKHPQCVAIGECGLDAMIDTPMTTQQKILEQHLRLAQTAQLPILLHSRKADHFLLQLLKKYPLTAGGIRHAFTGSVQMAQALIEHNLLLGIGGSITYQRARKTRAAVQKISLEHIVLETDAPDMPLQGFQGQVNTPSQLLKVATCLAELRQEHLQKIAEQTTKNSETLFAKATRHDI